MSGLDRLYKEYRTYCKKTRLDVNQLTELILYDDGSGRIQKKWYVPTEANPFKVETENIIKFKSPGSGARQLTKLNELQILEQKDTT